MKLFLKAKAWHYFVLTFLLPMGIQFFLGREMIDNASAEMNPFPAMIYNYMGFLSVSLVVIIISYLGWFWAVGLGLQKFIAQEHQIKTTWFKVALIIPLIYFIVAMVYYAFSLKDNYIDPTFFNVMTPFHIISIVCLFYCMYFTARTYKTVLLQRHVSFEKCMAEFFMIWFFPFGIWVIQPKINKMIEKL